MKRKCVVQIWSVESDTIVTNTMRMGPCEI